MNCEESIGKILGSIRKEATLKVEAHQALLHCFCTSWGTDTKGFNGWAANRLYKSACISTINNTQNDKNLNRLKWKMAKELNNLFISLLLLLLIQKVWFKHGWNSFPQEFDIFWRKIAFSLPQT